MADIFLSYSREDRATVAPLADALAAAGYSVWWDRQLSGGKRYLEETESELNAAKAVLVVWSSKSVTSHWVADEAGAGRDTGRLLPVTFDGATPPLGFRQFQVIDLSKWPGDGTGFKDLLAGLGRLAPPSGEARPQAAGEVARKAGQFGLPGNPVVLGLAALAFVAILAVALMNLMAPVQGKAPDVPVSQRTAFFGFTVDGDDIDAADIAKSATTETFNTLSALGFDTSSASETQNIERGAQLARAKELGARYALGGEVRREGDQFKVTIRLEDVQTRAILLQETIPPGGEDQKVSLPVQAAARATNVLGCYINNSAGLRTETDEVLRALSRVCLVWGGSFVEIAERRRELAQMAPDSPGVQANYALSLFIAMPTVAATEHPAMREDIDEALERVRAADPDNMLARVIQADLPMADGGSLAEAEQRFLAIKKTDPNFFFLNMRYGLLLIAVGRNREALTYLRTGERLNPHIVGMRVTLAQTLARTGWRAEAEEKFRYNHTRLQDDGGNWRTWVQSALFDGAGKPREVLALAPPNVPPEVFACMKELVDGALSTDLNVRAAAADQVIDCKSNDRLSAASVIRPAAAFGRLDEAFAFATEGVDPKAYTLWNAWVLFSAATRPMREDDRFLDLVTDLGIYQYWLDSGTQPDICALPEEKHVDVCVKLDAEQRK